MRKIALDTETGGMSPEFHSVVDIGCVEMGSDNKYQVFLKPAFRMDAGAIAIHGKTHEFLEDKPSFADVVDEFLAFIYGATLVIHNAPFDTKFLNTELKRIGREPLETYVAGIEDSLAISKVIPGAHDLDTLCERYGVSIEDRELHSALLDCELLTAVYEPLIAEVLDITTRAAKGGCFTFDLGTVPTTLDESIAQVFEIDSIIKAMTKAKNARLDVVRDLVQGEERDGPYYTLGWKTSTLTDWKAVQSDHLDGVDLFKYQSKSHSISLAPKKKPKK